MVISEEKTQNRSKVIHSEPEKIIRKASMVRSQLLAACVMTWSGFVLSELYSHLVMPDKY